MFAINQRKPISALLLFLCTILSTCLFAKPVTVDEVRKVAGTFLTVENIRAEKQLKTVSTATIQQKPTLEFTIADVKEVRGDGGKVLAYVTELQPEGYIITSADDKIRPVIGYSFKGRFPFEDSKQNVLLHLVQWDMETRLKTLRSDAPAKASIIESNNDSWNSYTASNEISLQTLASDSQTQWPGNIWWCPECGNRQSSSGTCLNCGQSLTLMRGGWITTLWGQGVPFYDECPYDPSDGYSRCLVGCVATAMAQILNYWQYPNNVHFDISDKYLSKYYNEDSRTWVKIHVDDDCTELTFPGFSELNSYYFNYDISDIPNYAPYLEVVPISVEGSIATPVQYIRRPSLS